SEAATLQSLRFNVTTAAGQLRMGVYDATGPGGNPGAKKAETAAVTPVVGWNTANVTQQVALQPGKYWIAFLPSSNSLRTRHAGDGTFARLTGVTFGTLPTTFSTSDGGAPITGADHWSFYAILAAANNTAVMGEPNVLTLDDNGNGNQILAQPAFVG